MEGSTRTGGRVRSRGQMLAVTVILILMAPLAVAGTAAQPADTRSEWTPPRTVYLPETGQTLDQLFLDLWREGGGAGAFGYPITPELEQPDGRIIQYLQYARFEYWPDGDEHGTTVTLGKIGAELRPISLPRTVSTFAASRPERRTAEASGMLQAWLPVAKRNVPADNPDIRYVEATKHTVWGGFRDWWENNGEAGYLGNPLTEEYTVDGVAYQVFERGQLAWTEDDGIRLVPVGQILADKYRLPQDPVKQGDIPIYSEALFVPPPPIRATDPGPGPVPGAAKSIVVSISQQTMWVYDGDTVVLSSLVSTGKPGFETPTGRFSISKKVAIQDMEGLIGGEYYDVADVPDVMYFTGVGHAIHGAYWHNNFGAVMSHGCVNLPLDVAAWLYDWTPMDTPVLIVP